LLNWGLTPINGCFHDTVWKSGTDQPDVCVF
jgi:hypothetical protein